MSKIQTRPFQAVHIAYLVLRLWVGTGVLSPRRGFAVLFVIAAGGSLLRSASYGGQVRRPAKSLST